MIDKYKKFVERVDDESYEGWDDIQGMINELEHEHDFTKYDNKDDEGYSLEGHEDDDLDDNEDMEHLKYLLRTMFKNKGFESLSITNDRLDLTIRCILSFREKLSDLVSLFDMVNKLSTDILPQYKCDFDMWYNKQGQTLEFNFIHDDSDYDDADVQEVEEDEEYQDDVDTRKPFDRNNPPF